MSNLDEFQQLCCDTMPKFEVSIEVDGWFATAQDLADEILKIVPKKVYSPHNVALSVTKIEVKQVGVRIKNKETYFRK